MLGIKSVVMYIVFALLATSFYFYQDGKQRRYLSVQDFASCIDAGYVVQITYPESCVTPDKRVFVNELQKASPFSSSTQKIAQPLTKENIISVESVTPNQIITSPLRISGKARGFWYFEGSFPLELIDASGKRIFMKPVLADGEWLTEDFVPFDSSFTFSNTQATSGTLIFHKDNPGAGVGQGDTLKIPVRFDPEMRNVSIFLYDENKDTDTNGVKQCSEKSLVSVARDIPISKTPLQDTLSLLLTGSVRNEERASGLRSFFPLTGLYVKTVTLTELGEILITFDDPYHKSSGDACRANLLRKQLELTLKQFPEISSVIIKPDTIFRP